MGAFYTSLHLKDKSQEQVLSALKEIMSSIGATPLFQEHETDPAPRGKLRYAFFISPSTNGWVSLYGNQWELINEVGLTLSAKRMTQALFLYLHDGDVWFYTYYDRGKYVDAFNSWTEYFKTEPEPISLRNAELLKPILASGVTPNQAYSILQKSRNHERKDAPEAEAFLVDFAKCCGISEVNADYQYLYLAKQEEERSAARTPGKLNGFQYVAFLDKSEAAERLKQFHG